jgi:hypothetical protein
MAECDSLWCPSSSNVRHSEIGTYANIPTSATIPMIAPSFPGDRARRAVGRLMAAADAPLATWWLDHSHGESYNYWRAELPAWFLPGATIFRPKYSAERQLGETAVFTCPNAADPSGLLRAKQDGRRVLLDIEESRLSLT